MSFDIIGEVHGYASTLERLLLRLGYGVGRPGGKLAAYRWDGERRLREEGFVWMARAKL